MSQVRPGDQGPGQRPGQPTRKGAPPRRPAAKTPAAKTPAAKTTAKGRPGGQGAKPGSGRPGTPSKGGGAKGPAGKGAARANRAIAARTPQRFSPSTMAFAAVGVVIVIILVFVVVKVTGGSGAKNPGGLTAPAVVTASPTIVNEVTGVSNSVINAVGTGGSVVGAPTVPPKQPPLTSDGKPEVLFIGAEFCPYCAAERWAMINAFSRFGTFSGLKETTSSPWDSPPAIATFTFRDTTFTSKYFTFVPVEHESNDKDGLGTRTILKPLTSQQNNLWSKYSSLLGLSGEGFPFVDLGNKVFVTGPSYDPQTTIFGLNQPEIAAKLTNPNDPVTQAIVGTANYLTASVCSLTNDQPAAVCSQSGVRKAASALKLS